MEIGIAEPYDISHGPITAPRSRAILTGETVTWKLTATRNHAATAVTNGSGPMAADGDGHYEGTVPANCTSGLTEDTVYYLFILSSGKVCRIIPVTARYRGAT